jgi:hypothetical protein
VTARILGALAPVRAAHLYTPFIVEHPACGRTVALTYLIWGLPPVAAGPPTRHAAGGPSAEGGVSQPGGIQCATPMSNDL